MISIKLNSFTVLKNKTEALLIVWLVILTLIYIFCLIQIGPGEKRSKSKERKINNKQHQLVTKDGSGGFPCESCARDRSTRAQSESPLVA